MSATATHPATAEALANLDAMCSRVRALFAPPEEITVSEWSRRHRVLPKGTSPRPGVFHPERFQVEMMDCILNPDVHEIVCIKSTQIGWSDAILNNLIGYFIDVDPKPMMLVQPTIDNAKDYGRKRITPMVQSSPVLRAKVREATTRRSGNTLALKEFPGGFLKLTGANSGSGLRSDPVPVVLFDEADGYPLDVDGEGDPIEIATRRTDAYPDYKIIKGSTPAKPKGLSRIERDFLRSDQRRFYVPCPYCGCKQVLWWRDPVTKEYRLRYEVDDDQQVIASSVLYLCEQCKRGIAESYKQRMLDAGEWIARFPDRPVVGFHINALYSPWRENWKALAQEWQEAARRHDPEKLKVFITLRLGETWEEAGDVLEGHVLKARRETWKADVPAGVGLLTAAVDVQNDRLEMIIKGWGAGEESWLIAYQQFFGDPGREDIWNELDELLLTEFENEVGRKLRVSATFIDSGGHHTEAVYRFTKTRNIRRVFACKGSSEYAQPILGKFTLNNTYRVKLFTLGTDTAKDRIFSRLRIPTPGAGYVHLPEWADEEYLEQLTAEKAITKYKRGRGMVREYVKTRARNEALDLEVYALAALYVLGAQTLRNLKAIAERMQSPEGKQEEKAETEERPKQTWDSGGGWNVGGGGWSSY
jgi:phage terminase large subunit GpA-like protein